MRSPRALLLVILAVSVTAMTSSAQSTRPSRSDDSTSDQRRDAVASARAELAKARADLDAVTRRVRESWEGHAGFLDAERRFFELRREFEALRDPLLQRLRETNPEYAELVENEQQASATVERERDDAIEEQAATQPSKDEAPVATTLPAVSETQQQAAEEKLKLRQRKRELEKQAIAADPAASEAQRRLDDARFKLRELTAQLDAVMENDPDYKAAREAVAAARARIRQAAAGQ